jgi:hypothetical protein
MDLAQDNDVVHTLTPDRSEQPFDKAILPRRGRCGRLVPDAHGAHSARDDATSRDPGSGNAEPHPREMPRLFDVPPIPAVGCAVTLIHTRSLRIDQTKTESWSASTSTITPELHVDEIIVEVAKNAGPL